MMKRENDLRASGSVPSVSVIVPTYDRPQMLKEALKSILNQSYQDFEIIVVNDGGQEIGEVLTALNRPDKIRNFRHKWNRGMAAARNTGLKAARGKYIAYLDDDDIFYRGHLETLITFLGSTRYLVAYTDAYRARKEIVHGKSVVTRRVLPYSFDFDCDRILVSNQVPMLCVMHETTCLNRVGYFDETLRMLEDWDLLIRLSRNFRIAHLKKVTCEFRSGEYGSSVSTSRQGEFLRTVMRIHARNRTFSALPNIDKWLVNPVAAKVARELACYHLYSKRWGRGRAAMKMWKEQAGVRLRGTRLLHSPIEQETLKKNKTDFHEQSAVQSV